MGSRSVAQLAAECRVLKAMVHVSTAYVNINAERGSVVHEQIYGLAFGDQAIVAEDLAQVMMPPPSIYEGKGGAGRGGLEWRV